MHRSARLIRIARKDSAAVTNELLVAAPGAGWRVVIDFIYYNTSVAGSIEIFNNTTGWTDADGLIGGNFGANGGFIGPRALRLEGAENQAVSWTTTGATPVIYLVLLYHLET